MGRMQPFRAHGLHVYPSHSALQAVMGSLVKRLLAPHLMPGGYSGPPGLPAAPSPASRVYHATVMPCYDKKLEAVREELVLPGGERLPEVRGGFEASHFTLPIRLILQPRLSPLQLPVHLGTPGFCPPALPAHHDGVIPQFSSWQVDCCLTTSLTCPSLPYPSLYKCLFPTTITSIYHPPLQVDCCLTTSEVQRLLVESGVSHLREVPLWNPPGAAEGGCQSLAAMLASGREGREIAPPPPHAVMGGPKAPDAVTDDMDVDGGSHGGAIDGASSSPAEAAVPSSSTPSGEGRLLLGSGGYMDFVFRWVACMGHVARFSGHGDEVGGGGIDVQELDLENTQVPS